MTPQGLDDLVSSFGRDLIVYTNLNETVKVHRDNKMGILVFA